MYNKPLTWIYQSQYTIIHLIIIIKHTVLYVFCTKKQHVIPILSYIYYIYMSLVKQKNKKKKQRYWVNIHRSNTHDMNE